MDPYKRTMQANKLSREVLSTGLIFGTQLCLGVGNNTTEEFKNIFGKRKLTK